MSYSSVNIRNKCRHNRSNSWNFETGDLQVYSESMAVSKTSLFHVQEYKSDAKSTGV